MTLRRFLPIEFVRALGKAIAHQHGENIVAEIEGTASPKRQKALNRSNNYLLEAIERAKNTGGGAGGVFRVEEDGVLRVKIVVRKQELKQMLGMINGGGEDNVNGDYNGYRSLPPSSISVEERLNLLRRKHLLRSNAVIKNSIHCWSPELQSIPEE